MAQTSLEWARAVGHRDRAEAAVALVIVDDLTGNGNLSAGAIDHVVGFGDARVHGCGIRDEFEGGPGLVDVADRVVAEHIGRGVANLVGIEGGTNGEGQNLPGMHILHDDRAVQRLRALHGVIERALRHELNVFVDGENQILPGLGVALT